MIHPPPGDAFSVRNRYAMRIDFEREPPFFKLSDTHYAATWLLHPKAKGVQIPDGLKSRIERMKRSGVADA
jgi:oligopeptide transport system ATP-binding protein